MAGAISGNVKIDIALEPSSIASAATATSRYFPMRDYDKACFIVTAGTMSAFADIDMRLIQAPTSTAPGAAIAIGTAATMNADASNATITNSESVVFIGTTGNTGFTAGTLAVNGITYTFASTVGYSDVATSDFAATRYVATCSGMTTNALTRTMNHLTAYINHATYGVSGLVATLSGGTSHMTITSSVPGEYTVDATVGNTGIDIYSNMMVGYIECHGAELATSSGYDYVALELMPSTVAKLGAVLVRSGARYSADNAYITGDNIV